MPFKRSEELLIYYGYIIMSHSRLKKTQPKYRFSNLPKSTYASQRCFRTIVAEEAVFCTLINCVFIRHLGTIWMTSIELYASTGNKDSTKKVCRGHKLSVARHSMFQYVYDKSGVGP